MKLTISSSEVCAPGGQSPQNGTMTYFGVNF